MKHWLFCFFTFFFFACNENVPATEPTPEKPIIVEKPTQKKEALSGNINASIKNNTFQKTVLAGKVNFKVTCENGETSTIHVESEGLEVRKYEKDFTVKGQLVHAFGLDLNNDGFFELYLVVRGNDDSGNLSLIGVASYNDKSAGEIYIKDVEVLRKANTDKVYVHYGNLTREYYDETNQLQVYNYKLTKGETGYILNPARIK